MNCGRFVLRRNWIPTQGRLIYTQIEVFKARSLLLAIACPLEWSFGTYLISEFTAMKLWRILNVLCGTDDNGLGSHIVAATVRPKHSTRGFWISINAIFEQRHANLFPELTRI